MLWRSVQLDRPRASTSGGQSFAGTAVVVVGEELVAVLRPLAVENDAFLDRVFLDWEAQKATELHVRQLELLAIIHGIYPWVMLSMGEGELRFSILSEYDAFGKLLWGGTGICCVCSRRSGFSPYFFRHAVRSKLPVA
jgi:hypothetical protein